MSTSKQTILKHIRRLAAKNGRPPGTKRFQRATGISSARWLGIHWVRWSDAVAEAGLTPNTVCKKFSEELALDGLIRVIRKLGKFPTKAELRFHCSRDPDLPSVWPIFRLGKKRELVIRVLDHCAKLVAEKGADYDDVIAICAPLAKRDVEQSIDFVYLFRNQQRYKIGRTNCVARRRSEIATHLAGELTVVHVIKTSDPSGVEAYWKKRFAAKRIKGEWFALDAADVAAFKQCTFCKP